MSSGGRNSRVVLLDGTTWNFHVHNKLLGSDFLYLITSHLSLTEAHYFGLCYLRTTGPYNTSKSIQPAKQPVRHHQREWLQLDKKVLDQDVAKQPGELVFHFQIKFYVSCVCSLFDILTVELFYQQARCLVAQEVLTLNAEDTIDLASYALQEANGDYVNDQSTREAMKSMSLLTTSLLKTYPSISYCENLVLDRYKQLTGTSRGLALLRYVFLVERQPSYGQHYYDVKDKCGLPWLLGVGSKGLTLCDHNDPKNPRRSFAWHQLNNLHYKEKKFYFQLQQNKRSSTVASGVQQQSQPQPSALNSSTSARQRHPSSGPSSCLVMPCLVWVCASQHQAKSLWQMAVEQHQFACSQGDRNDSSHQGRQHWLPTKSYNEYSSKFIDDLAEDITCFGVCQPARRSFASSSSSSSSLLKRSRQEGADVGSSQSLSSRSSSQTSSSQCSDMGQIRPFSDKAEFLGSLKCKASALDQLLKQKIDHYQSLCNKESELTGALCSDVTELLALSFSKTPQNIQGLMNGRVKTSSKRNSNSTHSVASSSSSAPGTVTVVGGEGSKLLKHRVGTMLLGTGFHLSHKHVLRNLINPNPSELDRLELELDLQSKIQSAAHRLAEDDAVGKGIKKKRKKSYKEATKKLRELESKVIKLRKEEEKLAGLSSSCSLNRNSDVIRDKITRELLYSRPVSDMKMTSSSSLTSSSMTSSSIQSQESCSDATTTSSSNIKSSYSNISSSSSSSSPSPSPSSSSSPSSHKMTTSQSCQPIITGGYLPSSVYKTKTQYRSTTYPTIPTLSLDPCSASGSVASSRTPVKSEVSPPYGLNPATPRPSFGTPVDLTPTRLDATLTSGSCDTTLDDNAAAEAFNFKEASDSNPSSLTSPQSARVDLAAATCPDASEVGVVRPLSRTPAKTTSYLSIYLSGGGGGGGGCGGKSHPSRSDVDLRTQVNSAVSYENLARATLTAALSNPVDLSDHGRLRLDGRSHVCLPIKMRRDEDDDYDDDDGDGVGDDQGEKKQKKESEENFYDLRSKCVIKYGSRDDFRNGFGSRDEESKAKIHISPLKAPTTTTTAITTPATTSPPSPPRPSAPHATSHKVRVSNNNNNSSNQGSPTGHQLPKPQYMPQLKTRGKHFFNYPPPEVIISQKTRPVATTTAAAAATTASDQQFSYLEKVQKLRLGGSVGSEKIEISP